MSISPRRSLRIYQECPICKRQIKGIKFKNHVLRHWILSKSYEKFDDFIRRIYESKIKIPFRLLDGLPRHFSAVGKKKTAIAKAIVSSGSGCVRINNVPVEIWQPEVAKQLIMEPLILAAEEAKQLGIEVKTSGGGFMGQAQAARIAIARGIIGWTKDPSLKMRFIKYDRRLLVDDPRVKEPKKFSRKGARARRQKSYR